MEKEKKEVEYNKDVQISILIDIFFAEKNREDLVAFFYKPKVGSTQAGKFICSEETHTIYMYVYVCIYVLYY